MESKYKISQLCEKFNITPRLIYYYISIGLLPPAGRRGKNNLYTEEFVTKLEHVLKYRGKIKLSSIPFLNNVEFQQESDMTVLTLKFFSSSTDFVQYACDSCINTLDKFSINYSVLCPKNSSECMIVAFPINAVLFAAIEQNIKGLKEFSRSYNGGVMFRAYISDDAFIPTTSQKVIDG